LSSGAKPLHLTPRRTRAAPLLTSKKTTIVEHDVPEQQAPLVWYLATLLATKVQTCLWSKHGCCGTTTFLYIHTEQKTQGKNH
jgi:hypothetical protein